MKYINAYRDKTKCEKLAAWINACVKNKNYKIMEVCGTHTASIRKFGIRSLLSEKIELISGPGCPVCVTSDDYLRNAIRLSKKKDMLLATYPDMLKVPVDESSLEDARSQGADIRGVTSALEALDLARRFPRREIVFLAVGFETTAPGTAIALQAAKKEKIKNFSVYSAHKTIPEALLALAADETLKIQGFLLPGHVSAIIGVSGYRPIMKSLKVPCVVTGFEPLDILLAIYTILQAIHLKNPILENEYKRIVRENGNQKAQILLNQVFEKHDSVWRGLGIIRNSGLALRKHFKEFDSLKRFCLKKETAGRNPKRSCLCAEVLKGKISPTQCSLFGKSCIPQSPKGPCMVSAEGTCRSFYEYQ